MKIKGDESSAMPTALSNKASDLIVAESFYVRNMIFMDIPILHGKGYLPINRENRAQTATIDKNCGLRRSLGKGEPCF